jgi:hypothetical protein
VSTQTRTVRPFVGLDPLQRILSSNAHLLVGTDRLEDDETLIVNADSFLIRPIAIELALDDDLYDVVKLGLVGQARALGFEPGQLELVVVATSPYLKIAEILLRCPFDCLDGHPRVFPLAEGSRPRAFSSPRSGCTVDLYVVLADQVERRPLRPWRRGTWLARTSYAIASELAPVGFTPRPLSDEVRDHYGIAPDAVRFITFEEDESPLDPGTSEGALLMYVDTDVLARLAAGANKAASELFQLQLFLDAVVVILEVARADERFESMVLSDLDDSLFGRMIDGFSRNAKQTSEEREAVANGLLSLAKESPDVFMTHVEHAIGLRKTLNEVLDL